MERKTFLYIKLSILTDQLSGACNVFKCKSMNSFDCEILNFQQRKHPKQKPWIFYLDVTQYTIFGEVFVRLQPLDDLWSPSEIIHKISRLKTISMEDTCKTENVMIRVIKVWDITIMGGTDDGQTLVMVALLLNLSDRLSKLSIRQVAPSLSVSCKSDWMFCFYLFWDVKQSFYGESSSVLRRALAINQTSMHSVQ